MKILMRENNIIGWAGDDYEGPEDFLPAPDDFQQHRPSDYVIKDGQIILDVYNVIINATQQRLDTFAQSRSYDGILSASTYATSTNVKFQEEGQKCVELRDATWAKLYEILSEVEAETRPKPESFAEIEDELPELVWSDPAPQEQA